MVITPEERLVDQINRARARAKELSLRRIAAQTGLNYGTIHEALRKHYITEHTFETLKSWWEAQTK